MSTLRSTYVNAPQPACKTNSASNSKEQSIGMSQVLPQYHALVTCIASPVPLGSSASFACW